MAVSIRVLHDGEDVPDDKFSCKFCGNKMNSPYKAVRDKFYNKIHGMEKLKEGWMKMKRLYNQVESRNVDAGKFLREVRKIEGEFGRLEDELGPKSLSEKLELRCEKCYRNHFFTVSIDTKTEPFPVFSWDVLAELPILKKDLIEAGQFLGPKTFKDFERLLTCEDEKQAAKIIKSTLKELREINNTEIRSFCNLVEEFVKELENKETKRRIEVLRKLHEMAR